MNKDLQITDSLCRRYCVYHKPGKNENLACAGYTVIERLAKTGKAVDMTNASSVRNRTAEEALVLLLCPECGFREQDCDFVNDRDAQACGGFVLLAHLLGSGRISTQDVRNTRKP